MSSALGSFGTFETDSDGGEKRTVECDTVDEFMNVLNFVRDKVEEERVFYSDPL